MLGDIGRKACVRRQEAEMRLRRRKFVVRGLVEIQRESQQACGDVS